MRYQLHTEPRQLTSAIYHLFGFEQIEYKYDSIFGKSPLQYMNQLDNNSYLYYLNGDYHISTLEQLRDNLPLVDYQGIIDPSSFELSICNLYHNNRPIQKNRQSVQKAMEHILADLSTVKLIFKYCYDHNIAINNSIFSEDMLKLIEVELNVNHRL